MMGLFEQFPYQNFHELNLDWLINEIKTLETSGLVSSVNGMTGDVILYEENLIRLPDVPNSSWNLFRKNDDQDNGIEFTKNQPMTRIQGTNRYAVYDAGNPPPYPVTSVNGSTGAVTLYPNNVTQLPSVPNASWNIYRITDGQENGLEWTKNSALTRIQGTSRFAVYDAGNPPPYPVTSVDGQTGAVSTYAYTSNSDLQLPVDTTGTSWSINRNIGSGNLGLLLGINGGHEEAYIQFDNGITPSLVKLLTPADIPSSSGVVSFNGQTGVVTATGSDLKISTSSTQSIEDVIDELEEDIAIIVNGNTSTQNVTIGQYVFVRDSTITGITDGLYTVNANKAAGSSYTSADLTAVNIGGFNSLLAPTYQRQSTISNGTGYVDFTKIGHLVTMLVSITPNDSNTSITLQIPDNIFYSSQNVYDKRNIQGSNIYLYFYQNTSTITISHTTNANIAISLTYIADH